VAAQFDAVELAICRNLKVRGVTSEEHLERAIQV
jgi:hypothetical protein